MIDPIPSYLPEAACYEWGALFASAWTDLVTGMNTRAAAAGLTQQAGTHHVDWLREGRVTARFVFLADPSVIDDVREVFNDPANVAAPLCYVIVRQPDAHDDRGDVIFDIFTMSSQSYLCHHNRVFTAPAAHAA